MQPKHPRNLGVMRRVARSCLIAALALVAASTASLAAMLPIEIRSGLPWASGSLNSGGPFEAWRGGRVEDVKTVFFGINDWQHMAASAGGLSYRLPQYQMIVALGMLPRSSAGQLAQCAAGQFDTQISAVTNGMLANGGQAAFLAGRPIIIRLGWEANNTKGAFPWRIVGNGFTWRDCFRRWVDILDPKVDTDGNPATPPQRTGRFRIVWNMANKGTFEYPINNIWPGNDYVDIVGSEFYDRCPTVKNGDEAGWRLASNGRTASGSPVGPVAWLAFARSKGKKYAVPEWGIGGPNTVNCGASQDKGYDNPFVVRKMFEFFTANADDIAFEAYFNGHGYAEGERGSHMIFDPEPGLPNPIDPTHYRLTTDDGMVYEIDQFEGVRKVTDLGTETSLTYSHDGVLHSSGIGITFVRDAQDRITQLQLPDGQTIDYTYTPAGDLDAVSDQVQAQTHFGYVADPRWPHYLQDIIDARGVRVSRNEYDDDGRLRATIDAQGHRIEYTNDLVANSQTITDRRGNNTTYVYDASGRVLFETNALQPFVPASNTKLFTGALAQLVGLRAGLLMLPGFLLMAVLTSRPRRRVPHAD